MVWAILVAAGRGTRMGFARNKVYQEIAGQAVLARCIHTFLRSGLVDGVTVVLGRQDEAEWAALSVKEGLQVQTAWGGATRQESVENGLQTVPEQTEIVLVHDAARPFATPSLLARCIACARATGSGVAAVPLKDTVAQCDAKDGMTAPLIRDRLRAMQTPQGFRANWLREAYACARREGWTATDDASLVMRCGYPVQLVMGELENIKLTTPEDMLLCEAILRKRQAMVVRTEPPRVGHGYDAHRLVAERALVLCGQTIPYEKGLLGHSDADVAVHALMDALLGAAGLGDIGRHFPDADPAYAGISSMCLLNAVLQKVAARGYRPTNVDVTIIAQRPKLKDFIPAMQACLASSMTLPLDAVNVKATTTEGLGFEGEGAGISAHAVAMLAQNPM